MCAIGALIGRTPEGKWNDSMRLMEALLLASQLRGMDATGYAARTEPFKHRGQSKPSVIFNKLPLPAEQFIATRHWRQLQHRRSSAVVLHCRWATHGSPADPRNNHPHIGKGGLYLCHNGIIGSYRDIADRHGLALDLLSECDSEVLVRLMAKSADPIDGLRHCLNECRHGSDSMSVVVLDAVRGQLYLARNEGRPMWLMRLRDRRWLVGSTQQILLETVMGVFGDQYTRKIDQLFPLAPDEVHVLGEDGTLLAVG